MARLSFIRKMYFSTSLERARKSFLRPMHSGHVLGKFKNVPYVIWTIHDSGIFQGYSWFTGIDDFCLSPRTAVMGPETLGHFLGYSWDVLCCHKAPPPPPHTQIHTRWRKVKNRRENVCIFFSDLDMFPKNIFQPPDWIKEHRTLKRANLISQERLLAVYNINGQILICKEP